MQRTLPFFSFIFLISIAASISFGMPPPDKTADNGSTNPSNGQDTPSNHEASKNPLTSNIDTPSSSSPTNFSPDEKEDSGETNMATDKQPTTNDDAPCSSSKGTRKKTPSHIPTHKKQTKIDTAIDDIGNQMSEMFNDRLKTAMQEAKEANSKGISDIQEYLAKGISEYVFCKTGKPWNPDFSLNNQKSDNETEKQQAKKTVKRETGQAVGSHTAFTKLDFNDIIPGLLKLKLFASLHKFNKFVEEAENKHYVKITPSVVDSYSNTSVVNQDYDTLPQTDERSRISTELFDILSHSPLFETYINRKETDQPTTLDKKTNLIFEIITTSSDAANAQEAKNFLHWLDNYPEKADIGNTELTRVRELFNKLTNQ